MRTLLSLLFIIQAALAAETPLPQAEKLFSAGKEEEAKQVIARFLTENETSDAYVQVGTLYARRKDWTNSVHYLQIASARSPQKRHDPL